MNAAAAAVFSYDEFLDADLLSLSGSAFVQVPVLRLTQAVGSQGGSAWHRTRQPLGTGFETVFRFRVGGGTGGDGFAFMLQDHADDAVGPGAGSLAYYGITRSVAVEFDTFLNSFSPSAPDPSANHVSVQTRGVLMNSAEAVASIGYALPPFTISDGQIHTARIRYHPGTLQVFFDGAAFASLSVPLHLNAIEGQSVLGPNRDAWVGFTAGTGAATDNHDILSWSFRTRCHADVDMSGGYGVADVFGFLRTWFSSDPGADWSGDSRIGVDDIFAFLREWFAGCAD